MAETTTQTTPAPAIDPKIIADAVSASVAAALKPVTEALAGFGEQLKTLQPQAPATQKPGQETEAKALSADDIVKLLDKRDADRAATTAKETAIKTAVQDAAKKHLAGVPEVYHVKLPQTADAAALESAAKQIREQFQADLKAAGVQATNTGAAPAAGAQAPGGVVDVSKLNPVQKIAMMYQTTKTA